MAEASNIANDVIGAVAAKQTTVLEASEQADKFNLLREINAKIDELQREFPDNQEAQRLISELIVGRNSSLTPEALRRVLDRAIQQTTNIRADEAVKEVNLMEAAFDNSVAARDRARMRDITDATAAEWYHSFTDPEASATHRRFMTDLLLNSRDNEFEQEYNKLTPTARKVANEDVKQLQGIEATNKEAVEDLLEMGGLDRSQQAFLEKIQRSGHYRSEHVAEWIKKIREQDWSPQGADWTELNGEITRAGIEWKKHRAAAIEGLSKTFPEEAALAKELAARGENAETGKGEIYLLSQQYDELFKRDPAAKQRFEEARDKYHELKDDPAARKQYWDSLDPAVRQQIAVMDVTEATRIKGMQQALLNKGKEIDLALEKMKGMSAEEIQNSPYFRELNERVSSATTDLEKRGMLMEYAIEKDATLKRFRDGVHSDDFFKAMESYVGGVTSGKIVSSSIKIVAQTAEPVRLAAAQSMDEAAALAKSMLDQEKADLAAKKPGAGAYTHTLSRLVSHGDALNADAIKLINDINQHKMVGDKTFADQAWKEWERIDKETYSKVESEVQQTTRAALNKVAPGMAAGFDQFKNTTEFKKLVEEMKDPNNADLDRIKRAANSILQGSAGGQGDVLWAQVPAEDKPKILAFLYERGLHVSEYGVCHANMCTSPYQRKSVQKDGVAVEKEKEEEKTTAAKTAPSFQLEVVAIQPKPEETKPAVEQKPEEKTVAAFQGIPIPAMTFKSEAVDMSLATLNTLSSTSQGDASKAPATKTV